MLIFKLIGIYFNNTLSAIFFYCDMQSLLDLNLNTISQKDEQLLAKGLDDTAVHHTENLKLPKYHLKKSPIPQYRKPQCPPREGPFRQSKVTLPFSLSCSVDFFSPHIGMFIQHYFFLISQFNFDTSNYTECSHVKQTQEKFCLDKRVRQKFHKVV